MLVGAARSTIHCTMQSCCVYLADSEAYQGQINLDHSCHICTFAFIAWCNWSLQSHHEDLNEKRTDRFWSKDRGSRYHVFSSTLSIAVLLTGATELNYPPHLSFQVCLHIDRELCRFPNLPLNPLMYCDWKKLVHDLKNLCLKGTKELVELLPNCDVISWQRQGSLLFYFSASLLAILRNFWAIKLWIQDLFDVTVTSVMCIYEAIAARQHP